MENTTSEESKAELIFSNTQIIVLGIFCFIMAFFGILGNGTVLFSSLKYNAIRLDRVSLLYVQNLALADILYTICVIVPQLITYIARKWVLGKVYCIMMAQVGIIPVSANTMTVLTITGYRLKVILSPFSRASAKQAKISIAIIWIIAVVPVIVFAVYKSQSEFHQENGRCLSDIYDNDAARIPVMLCVGLIVLLPLFAITLFNIILVCIAMKHANEREEDRANYKALITVCCLSGLFIVSWTPYVVFTFRKMKNPTVSPVLDLLAFHCIFLNAFGNPILYTLTNRRFGVFVKNLLLNLVCKHVSLITDSSNNTGKNTKSSSTV